MPTADLAARKADLMGRTSTPAMKVALTMVEAKPRLTPEERMVRAWMIDELEGRFPKASAAVEAAFDAAGEDENVNYVAVLLANIP
jgi:hypothetical protein